jgi:hypothetical protein
MERIKIAVFLKDGELSDFFGANGFRVFVKDGGGWRTERDMAFNAVTGGSPAATRDAVDALPPMIADCAVLAGGALAGIPFSRFNQAGLHIFEIREISDEIFDEILRDIHASSVAREARRDAAEAARPVETETPGVYVLDLIALQTEFPEISSKKALTEFLENTPFMELRLRCRHVPPWIENSGGYDIEAVGLPEGGVAAVLRRKC